MSISFRGAKKYKKHNGFDKSAEIHSPLPAPVYFFNLVQNTDVTLSPLVEVGDTVEIGSNTDREFEYTQKEDIQNFVECSYELLYKVLKEKELI